MASNFLLVEGMLVGPSGGGRRGERERDREKVCVCVCAEKGTIHLDIPWYLKTLESLLASILVIVVSGKGFSKQRQRQGPCNV